MGNPSHIAGEANPTLDIENAIFSAALEIPDAEQRAEFLDKVYKDDPSGRADMESLLQVAGSSAAFFLEGKRRTALLARQVIDESDVSPVSPAEPVETVAPEAEGAKIGRYTLIRKIGEGGCGEIFEATPDGMRRPVALKIIRRGMDTDSVVSRFEAERHALEIMEHPNIARVQDAGTTPRGRPYFVMELVRGPRITTFCENEKLDLRDRLELFLTVCQAIQHAHQKGIVHRDLKPSNILVEVMDGIFVPKVIDFGIAKAVQGRLDGRDGSTQFDQFVGTPAYMSPEQVDMSGIDIDTRTDIYSLGALLYEILSGRPPFDSEELMRGGVTEMRRSIMEDNPMLPSEAVLKSEDPFAATLPTSREKWAAAIKGDLDWIVFKALEKERNRRYLTVNSLTMDIRRFLRNEPVIARKPSRRYSMFKFYQRNRIACLLGVAALLSLFAGLGTATVLYFGEKQALAEQARLKQVAQARANVSRAAILLSEGEKEQADQLLRESPLESIDASPEATEVFRSLGHWNAILGRWSDAANCFRLMNEANRLGDRDRVAESLDLLMTAPAYLEANQDGAYLKFRKEVIDRFVPARNTLQAEHLLKACLLLPADQETLDRLESTAEMCRKDVHTEKGLPPFPSWNALSLSLFHYRKGEYAESIRQAKICLSFDDQAGNRKAAANVILGLSLYHSGDRRQARSRVTMAKESLARVEAQADDAGFPPIGTWFAWSVARILIREADATFQSRGG